MRCIFCKKNSDDSKSIEHIIPESLGNSRHTLAKGVVCDQCNNYFARKIEGPLLSHVSFRNLRAWYQVPNKKGTKPSLYGFIGGTDTEIALRLNSEGYPMIAAESGRDKSTLESYFTRKRQACEPDIFVFPRDIDPPQYEMSRFLAKVGLEVVALRFLSDPSAMELMIDSIHFDRLRYWARQGDNYQSWPFFQRRVFPEETLMRHPITNEWVQAGFGFDLFMTKRTELFLAFCLYGYEFVINLGGPSIKGYEEWLKDNNNASPIIERRGLRLYQSGSGDSAKYVIEASESPISASDFDLAAMKSYEHKRDPS